MSPRNEPAPGAEPGAGDKVDNDDDEAILRAGADNLLSFAECLDLLDLDDDELLSFGTQEKAQDTFIGRQYAVAHLKKMSLDAYADHDVWCGLQPMRKVAKRGSNKDVLRLVALYADLDLAENKIPTVEGIAKVIDTLSDMVGATPVYITFSGHGYQPVWQIDPDDGSDLQRMLPLLQGWGQLVKQVAATHGGTADGVFDPARILRVPGTTNWKDPAAPVTTWAKAVGR